MIKTLKQYNAAIERVYQIFDATPDDPCWHEHLKLIEEITAYEDYMNFGIAPQNEN